MRDSRRKKISRSLALMLALWGGTSFAGEAESVGGLSRYADLRDTFRMDCRYHNEEGNPGVGFCYASAVYRLERGKIEDPELLVGCDHLIYHNQRAWLQTETTLDRIMPLSSATPAVEVFPQGRLRHEGTYSSQLDIHFGRFKGICYVHEVPWGA